MTHFFRVLDASVDEKAGALLRAVRGDERRGFSLDPKCFSKVPGSPFAYWVSSHIRDLFSRLPRLDKSAGLVRVGVATGDDTRFLRLWWEVSDARPNHWRPLAKGGVFSRFYADLPLVVDWRRDGEPIEISFIGARVKKPDFGRPGLTWPARTDGLSIRVLPAGAIFTHKGPAIFDREDAANRLFALASIMNTSSFSYLIALQLVRTELAQSYEVGIIQQTPVPELSDDDVNALGSLGRRAWSLRRTLETTKEISHAFVLPLNVAGYGTAKSSGLDHSDIEDGLRRLQCEIDERAFNLYGVAPEDRVAVETTSKRDAIPGDEDSAEGEEVDDETAEAAIPALPVNSWLVGVAFGRFDERLATGKRTTPPEPEPFDPLPTRSPGMWPEGEAHPVPPPAILVDDSGHEADIVAHAKGAAARAGVAEPADLRPWLAREFFPLHIRVYSKSRRKAPIYWQLATPSASYSVWLYLHALTPDTLYTVQRDYIVPKLDHEERRLEGMRSEAGPSPSATDRKQVAARETFVDELRALLAEVKLVTPLWIPNLDDGVVINAAPLWRLFPQHKPWQKELATVWKSLTDGEYDWSYMAMHLWPERVVPKCADDRSLAIAHALEEVFWVEDASGKWKRRAEPTTSVAELVKGRTSAAVKEALKGLMEAPAAAPSRKVRQGAMRNGKG